MGRGKLTKAGLAAKISPIKVATMIVGAVVVLIVGSEVYALATHDEDWAIGQRLIEQALEWKNASKGCCVPFCKGAGEQECSDIGGTEWTKEPCSQVPKCDEGCCLPQCENTTQAFCEHNYEGLSTWDSKSCHDIKECEKGCCWVEGKAVENIPKAGCNHMGGQWSKGKCQKGFSITLKGKTSGQANMAPVAGQEGDVAFQALMKMFTGGGIQVEQEVTIEAYTCADLPYATWTGKITSVTTGSNPKTGTDTKTETNDITLPFDEDGVLTSEKYGLGKIFTGQVDLVKMSVRLNYLGFGPADLLLEGQVRKGAPECKK